MSVQNEKTLDAYQKVAKNYLDSIKTDDPTDKVSKKLKDLINNSFKQVPIGSKVLEVGSADGETAKYIKSLGYNVTASDVAQDFLKAIKENGLDPLKFNILVDEFKDKYYVILCWKVFVHFTNEDALNALQKSYDALEENGLFIFNAINRECKKVDSEWADFPGSYSVGENRYFNYYTKEDMDKIISNTKFEIINFQSNTTSSGVKWLIYVLKK